MCGAVDRRAMSLLAAGAGRKDAVLNAEREDRK